MQLIKRITNSDMLGGAPEFMENISRIRSRGVLVDNMLNVAMIYMSKTNLYKLPGWHDSDRGVHVTKEGGKRH
jgi:8-oxo-dGTP diphosphatase